MRPLRITIPWPWADIDPQANKGFYKKPTFFANSNKDTDLQSVFTTLSSIYFMARFHFPFFLHMKIEMPEIEAVISLKYSFLENSYKNLNNLLTGLISFIQKYFHLYNALTILKICNRDWFLFSLFLPGIYLDW